MKKATLVIDRRFIIDKIDRNIYGSFVEQMGRSIYQNINLIVLLQTKMALGKML